jgi:hypothetical protein
MDLAIPGLFGLLGINFHSRRKILNIKDAPKHALTIWISKTTIFVCLFYCQKAAFVCEF